LNDLFYLISALAIQVQNLVSGFDKNGFQIKMVGPRLKQHFNHNKMVFLIVVYFASGAQDKEKKKIKSR
jgi:hypothetical protein